MGALFDLRPIGLGKGYALDIEQMACGDVVTGDIARLWSAT